MSGAALPSMTSQPDMQIVETRFGSFSGNHRYQVNMVEAMPGFEGCRRFILLSAPEIEPMTCLQGLDEQRPAFLAIDPRIVDPAYPCELDDLQRRRLGASASTPLLWLAIVHVSDDESTVNLRAPLVINPEQMRGLQLLAGHDEYHTDHRLG